MAHRAQQASKVPRVRLAWKVLPATLAMKGRKAHVAEMDLLVNLENRDNKDPQDQMVGMGQLDRKAHQVRPDHVGLKVTQEVLV